MSDPTCEYGYPTECGKSAPWQCFNRYVPFTTNACDKHVGRCVMVVVPPGRIPDETITQNYDYAMRRSWM